MEQENRRYLGKRKEEKKEKRIWIFEFNPYKAPEENDFKKKLCEKYKMKGYTVEEKNMETYFMTFNEYELQVPGVNAKNERERFTDMLDEIGGVESKKQLKDMYRFKRKYYFHTNIGTNNKMTKDFLKGALDIWYAGPRNQLSLIKFRKLVRYLLYIRTDCKQINPDVYRILEPEESEKETSFLENCCWKWYVREILKPDSDAQIVIGSLLEPFRTLVFNIQSLESSDGELFFKRMIDKLTDWYESEAELVDYIRRLRGTEEWNKKSAEKVYEKAEKMIEESGKKCRDSILDYV